MDTGVPERERRPDGSSGSMARPSCEALQASDDSEEWRIGKWHFSESPLDVETGDAKEGFVVSCSSRHNTSRDKNMGG